jgi:hypothetical protein
MRGGSQQPPGGRARRCQQSSVDRKCDGDFDGRSHPHTPPRAIDGIEKARQTLVAVE